MAKKKRSTMKTETRRRSWLAMPEHGRDRPTPERRAKSKGWRFVDGEDAGESYALDEFAGRAGMLMQAKQISPNQAEAAMRFEALAHEALGSPSGGDSIGALHRVDCSGHGEADRPANPEWREVGHALPLLCFNELCHVFWAQERPRSLDHLRRGLDLLIRHFKIE